MRKFALQRIMSRMLAGSGLVLIAPLALSLFVGERIWFAYLVPCVLALLLAVALHILGNRTPPDQAGPSQATLRRREGFFAVTAGWLSVVFFTAVAYQLTGRFSTFAHCFFESMSGYATVGATVVSDIESLPVSVNFARAWSHWVGGMGIVVLGVAILPELAVGGLQVFGAEATGFQADKLAPRIRDTARRLWALYAAMTAVLFALLLLGDLSAMDAIVHAFSTIATGGFSNKNASVGAFDSVYVESVLVVFMFISGMSFALLYRTLVQGKGVSLLRSSEVRLYTMLILSVIALSVLNVWLQAEHGDMTRIVRDATFTSVSLITTTGFGTADYDAWPQFTRLILTVAGLIGACAGSTGGGFKMVRLYLLLKQAVGEVRRLVRPRLVQGVYLGEHALSREAADGITGFMLLYVSALVVGAMTMTALGLDLVSGTTATISTLSGVGPGMGSVGPHVHYGHIPRSGLFTLSFLMLLGRLEIYTVLVLFTRDFWRRG